MVLAICGCVGPGVSLLRFGGTGSDVLSAWAVVFTDVLIRELTRLFALK